MCDEKMGEHKACRVIGSLYVAGWGAIIFFYLARVFQQILLKWGWYYIKVDITRVLLVFIVGSIGIKS